MSFAFGVTVTRIMSSSFLLKVPKPFFRANMPSTQRFSSESRG